MSRGKSRRRSKSARPLQTIAMADHWDSQFVIERHSTLENAWAEFVSLVQDASISDFLRYQNAIRWGLSPYEWCHYEWCKHDR